jgi:hypothetical protein
MVERQSSRTAERAQFRRVYYDPFDLIKKILTHIFQLPSRHLLEPKEDQHPEGYQRRAQ